MTRSFIFCIRSNMTSAQSSSFFRMNYQLLKSKCYICVCNSSKLFWSRHRHRWRHVCELRLFTKQSVWIGYVRMRKWWMHPKSTAVQFRERLWRRIRRNRLPHLPVSIVGSFLSLDAMLTSLNFVNVLIWSDTPSLTKAGHLFLARETVSILITSPLSKWFACPKTAQVCGDQRRSHIWKYLMKSFWR